MSLQGRYTGALRRIISVAALFSFLFYIWSVNFSMHVHYVDGKPVAHSHPFSDSGHQHSKGALDITSLLSVFVALCAASAALALISRKLLYERAARPSRGYAGHITLSALLRAPPAWG